MYRLPPTAAAGEFTSLQLVPSLPTSYHGCSSGSSRLAAWNRADFLRLLGEFTSLQPGSIMPRASHHGCSSGKFRLAAWIMYVAVTLGNLACQNSENCDAIREHGGIQILAHQCTYQADSPLVLFATVALRHLIRKSEVNRQAARDSDVVVHMQRILNEVPVGTVVSSAQAVLTQLERRSATQPSSPECATPQCIAFASSPEIGADFLMFETSLQIEDPETPVDKWTSNPLSSATDEADVLLTG
ncbi:hypothetical protein CYMTET_21574 [Cymbomonas tetramitiformis]|uniref:Ataxin-10 domain-containing protein n=1 Tax=Cymbomonas tetramitiformis TaxID=36881 RepID=A0AAE0G1M6_9CHLO|nr:hypothetical protein CYMTET_21574 [Cymbomonas tetramitiformis]